MNWSCRWMVAGLVVVASVAIAENKKQEANALTARAKHLSDIRAEGLPPFQMKVSFKIIKKDSATTEGTYTETWASPEKWRIETNVGDFRGVTVVNGDKRWTLNTSSTVPIGIGELGLRMELPKFAPEWTDRIRDRESNSRMMRCLESKPDSLGGRSLLCFDKTTGLVAEEIDPVARANGNVDHVCTYSDYQPFGEATFPRSIRCSENREPILESVLMELTRVASPDASLFAPIPNGKESVHCRRPPNQPKAIFSPFPAAPKRENMPYPIVLGLIIGTDGIPADVKIVRSFNPTFDKAAIEAVRGWRFEPATCDGQPVEIRINVEMNFAYAH